MTDNPTRPDRPIAAVFGSSRPKPPEPAWQLAEQLGETLGRAGFTVANGGPWLTLADDAPAAVEAIKSFAISPR